MNYQNIIRTVENFPKPGILFRDLTPLFADAQALQQLVQDMAQPFIDHQISHVVGIEARGFILGSLLAAKLNAGFVPVRKPGKLPATCLSAHYSLEYGIDSLQIHCDALAAGDKVLLVDDLIATGGTLLAAIELIGQLKAELVGISVAIELTELPGAALLRQRQQRLHSVIRY